MIFPGVGTLTQTSGREARLNRWPVHTNYLQYKNEKGYLSMFNRLTHVVSDLDLLSDQAAKAVTSPRLPIPKTWCGAKTAPPGAPLAEGSGRLGDSEFDLSTEQC